MLPTVRALLLVITLFPSLFTYAANLTEDFLAGKERELGESMDWAIAQDDPKSATVIHALIHKNTLIFIEPKTLVYASHNVNKYIPTGVEATQSVVNYAFLQAIADFTNDEERKKLMNRWIEKHVSPTLSTTLISPPISYLSLSKIATVKQLKKLNLRVLLPRPRETFPSK
jgi:hypothetical protein